MTATTSPTRAFTALGLAALLGLSACFTAPEYRQSEGSRAAFALADAVAAGERGDLPARARALGLVNAGVCRDVGGGRLYCNALRITDTAVGMEWNGGGSVLGVGFEEVRMCLAEGRAVGFIADGGAQTELPLPLVREYPEEFASLLQSSIARVQDDPSLAETGPLGPRRSITDLPLPDAIRRLGYGGRGSRFEVSGPDRFFASLYPPHEPAARACRSL